MGPVISLKHLERITAMVSRTKGKILVGGTRMQGPSQLDEYDLSQGSYYAPTVVTDIDVKDELWKEEVFGPVVVVKKFTVSAARRLFNRRRTE
jgi:acyl-CoA reductase-like NAD-dependent aldehyde dehydrogenase